MKNTNILFMLFSILLLNIISCSQNIKISTNLDDWFKVGSRPDLYEIGKDENVKYSNEPALFLKSITDVEAGFGTIMRNMEPREYFGKRIRLTGFIKSENINVWAGMWMRVDGPDRGKMLQFDNMSNRPIKGTNDWAKYEIVLDIPQSSTNIAYGVLVSGKGQVWFSNLSLEIAGNDVPTTNLPENYNIDWYKAGSKPHLFEIGKDENIKYNEQVSHYLKSTGKVEDGFGTIMKQITSDEYRGKHVRLTGNIKSENIDDWAGMWMRVDGPETGKSLQFDNMLNRPIKGTNDWTKYEIVLDVSESSIGIACGVLIHGNGQIWFDNLSFEVVGDDVPSTNMEEKK